MTQFRKVRTRRKADAGGSVRSSNRHSNFGAKMRPPDGKRCCARRRRATSAGMLPVVVVACWLVLAASGCTRAAASAQRDGPTSLPAYQMLNIQNGNGQKQQIFQQDPAQADSGNPNQAEAHLARAPQLLLSLRALPVSSRGTLLFAPRAQDAFAGAPGQAPSSSQPLNPHAGNPSANLSPHQAAATTQNKCSSHEPPRPATSATEVLAVEGSSVKLNFVIAGQGHPPGSSTRSTTTNNLHRLRLHWQRDNQLIGDLNLARGRFSSIQLASENEPDAIRSLLAGGGGGSSSSSAAANERNLHALKLLAANATARRLLVGGESNSNNKHEFENLFRYHEQELALFRHLLSLGKTPPSSSLLNANNLLLNGIGTNLLDESVADQFEEQNNEQNPENGFALFPFVNSRQLDLLQLGQHGGTPTTSSMGQQAARQANLATLRRLGSTPSGNKQRRPKPIVPDNFLADGQAIDWPTLGLYLETHSVPTGHHHHADKPTDENEHSCPGQLELEQLILIQFEINQLRLQDRGQYQLYVCQQSLVPGGAVASSLRVAQLGGQANAHQDCLQNQLVATISLQVAEDVPRLESWFEPQVLSQGDRFSIKCEATGFTLPQISWFLDGQLLSEHQRAPGSGGSDPDEAEETLEIPGQAHPSHEDSRFKLAQGESRSPSRGSANPFQRASATSASTLVVIQSSNQFFRIGDYVSQDNHVHSFVNSSAIRLADGGHYKCQANNGFHVVEHEARIDVRGPVNIERQLPYNASSLIGPSSRWAVQCPYSGFPLGSVEWYFRPVRSQQHSQVQSHGLSSSSSPSDQLQSLDYQDSSAWTGGLRTGRASRQKRRPGVLATSPTEGQEGLSYDEADDPEEQLADEPEDSAAGSYSREYLLSPSSSSSSAALLAPQQQQQDDPPDPDRDEWLSQASAMTASPNPEDYPEPLPDYPIPVAPDEQQPSMSTYENHLLGLRTPPRAQVTTNFQETESEQSPDYSDLEMSYQQTNQAGLSRRRRWSRASGNPAGEDWIKLPQSRRHQVHPNGTLAVHDIQQADQGYYKCHVLPPSSAAHELAEPPPSPGNPLEAMLNRWSNELYLSVLVPPVISPFSSSESLREGMRNFLTCSVIEGDSPVHLAWLKDGQPIEAHIARLEAQSRQQQQALLLQKNITFAEQQQQQQRAPARIKVETSNEYTSTLFFSQVDFRDNGNYTCMATNKAASVNYTARMVVNVPPKWTKNPRDVECVAGQSIVIDCQAEAQPSPRIWWEVGVVAPPTPHQVGPGAADKLESGPKLAEQFAPVGGSSAAALAGHLHHQPPNHYRTIISNSRIHILENASLVIRDVGRQDQGYYLCQAANNFGSLSALIKLSVNVGASFSNKYLMKYVKLNERIELDCDPQGQAPVTATWFMRQQQQQSIAPNQLNASAAMAALPLGHNQSLSNHHRAQQQQQAEQYSASVQQQQQQEQNAQERTASANGHRRRLFTATIQTELPASQQTGGINLSAHQPGADEQQQQQQQLYDNSRQNDHSSSFGDGTQTATGRQQQFNQAGQKLIEIDSSISFEILKLRNPANQQSLHGNGEMVRLHIKQAKRSSSGEYICHAANQFGADEKLIKLLVQEPPDPVQELSVLQQDSRSVSIAWSVPFTGNSPITSYTVEWAPIGGGDSGATSPAAGETPAGSSAGNTVSPPRWSHVVVQQPAATLGSLQPMTSYEIRVRAHNLFGSSSSASPAAGQSHLQLPAQQPFVVTTSEEAPGVPPSDIRAQALSSSSVQISWLAPSQVGPSPAKQHPTASRAQARSNIKGYYLGYRVANSNDSFIFKTVSVYSSAANFGDEFSLAESSRAHHNHLPSSSPNQNQSLGVGADSSRRLRVVVGDLKRSTKYLVIVQAYNSAGPGPQSDPIEVRTLLNDPPPAPVLRVGLVTYTSLELQWSFSPSDQQQEQQVDFSQDSATGEESADNELLEPLEGIKQMARLQAPSSSALTAGERPNSEANKQEQQAHMVDGYHLYFRPAVGHPGGEPGRDWQERRITQETHTIIPSPAVVVGGVGTTQVGSSSSTPRQLANDLTIVDQNSKLVAGGKGELVVGTPSSKQSAGWLRYHGANSTLVARTFRFLLDQLTCGNSYQIYLVAFNSFGSSLPSQIIRAKTRGSPPVAPRRGEDFIQANSTLVQLNLSAWLDGGCSLANFEIRYKQLRGRSEAVDVLREGLPPGNPQRLVPNPATSNWLLLSNNISPEQRSIELADLRPETWYGVWVTAESAAGKTDSHYAFMTLDKLGQVPSEALEPLPVHGQNLPALFRSSSTSGGGGLGSGTIRSLLYNFSGASGPNGIVVSPLILSACLCLIAFATCSLFLIRRYNNLVKDNHSIDLSSSRTTATSTGGSSGHGSNKGLGDPHHHQHSRHALGNHNNGLDHYSLDTKLNHACELEHHHLHQQQQQHYQNALGGEASPPDSSRDQHYSMKLSPCKTGATIITNSSSSTNGSSGAFLLSNGGGSSICDSAPYGSTPNPPTHQQVESTNNNNNSASMVDQHAPVDHLSQFIVASAVANCRHSQLMERQQQQQQAPFCSQPNCAHEHQLGKFATLARGDNANLIDHNNGGNLSPLARLPQQRPLSFRTLPHSSLRPVSTFLPQTALQNASGCQMTNGTAESLNRFYGAVNSQPLQEAQQQNLADQQQIYSKLRLLHQQYQAATSNSGYNLVGLNQQQQEALHNHEAVIALSQIYANRNGGEAAQQLGTNLGNIETQQQQQTAQQQQQPPSLLGPTDPSQQSQQAQAQQSAGGGGEQDDYALPFPPKWV